MNTKIVWQFVGELKEYLAIWAGELSEKDIILKIEAESKRQNRQILKIEWQYVE